MVSSQVEGFIVREVSPVVSNWRAQCSLNEYLAEHGIIADLQLTQFYQGVTSGGAEQRDAYGGKMDYNITFVGEQLAGWKGRF